MCIKLWAMKECSWMLIWQVYMHTFVSTCTCMYMYQCAYLTATLTEVSESPLADMMNDFYLSQSRKVWAIWLG